MPITKPIRAVPRATALHPWLRLYAAMTEGGGGWTADARGWSGALRGGAGWAAGPWGAEIAFPSGTQSGVHFGPCGGGPDVSVVALALAGDSTTLRTIVSKRTSTTGWQFYRGSSGALGFRAMSTFLSSPVALPQGEYRAIGVSFRSGQSVSFYTLGAGGMSQSTTATTAVVAPGNESLWLGAFDSSGSPSGSWMGRLASAVVIDAALDAAAMSELLHDQWNGRFRAIRPAAPRWLGPLAGLTPPPPPPPEPPSSVGPVRVRWYPGLRRTGR
jgi:hypothetical protein